jgi:hypothetical protein
MTKGIVWTCTNCPGNPEFDQAGFAAHLKEHGINEKNGNRTLKMHMKGDDYSLFAYDWEIGGLKFTQSVCYQKGGKRANNS